MPPPITKSHTTSISTSSAAISRRSRRSPHGRTPAAQCPARFAEGTLRSAQARHMARALGDQLSVAVAPITLSRFDDVESLDVDSKSLPPPRRPKTVPDSPWKCWRPATAAMRRWISAIVIRPHRNGSHPSRAPLTIVGKRTRPPPCSPTPTRCSIPPPALRHRPTHHRNELRAKRDNGNRRKLQCRERSFPVTRHQCKTVDGFASAIPGRACRSDCGPCRIGA